MEAVFHNLELANRSRGVAVRHTQMCHRIQCSAPDQHLRRLPIKPPRTYSLSEDRLHSKHLGFGQAAPVVAAFFFPLLAPDLPNPSQILIANQSLLFAISVLPDLRISTWRNGRLRLALSDSLVAIALVIGAIAADLLNLSLDLRQHLFQHLRIGDVVGRHHRRNDLARGLIGANMQFSPGATFRVAVLADFPFAFTEDLRARRVDDHMQSFILFAARQSDFQHRTAAAQLAVRHDGQVQAEQPHDRKRQADSGAQRQMIDLFERRHRADRRITVGRRMARLAGFLRIAPSRNNIIADPERQASALHECRVIVFPVAETVGAFGFLFLHKSRIPALSSPCFMQQRRCEV